MIWYFTGTGNSLWVAGQLSEQLNEPVQSITDSPDKWAYSLREEEKLIFVFPVHSWGPPVIVRRFIRELVLNGYTGQPVYSVCTCGDDCGYTNEMLDSYLKEKGLRLTAGYSVQMPNNYILFPGFDVDSKEREQNKLSKAPERLEQIISAIRGNLSDSLYTRGTVPFLKSRIIQPLFVSQVLGKNHFYAKENCISCGQCSRMCPTGTIQMKDTHPQWGDQCIQCLACFHRCPVRAIEYGKISLKKGRYTHPELSKQKTQ